jgi:pimeloyl-ACP methyl ester carboxylesterase
MAGAECGLIDGRVPFIRGGSGPDAVVFFGVNALFRRLDRTPDPARYAKQVARLLPGHRFTILGYAASSYGEIVADMAQAVPSPPDVVMGISFGGFVAIRFAAEHPELARRLVLLVSGHRFSAEGQRRVERQMAALERSDLPALIRENALLFRRPWYNGLVRLKLWKEGKRLGAGFRTAADILHDYRQLLGREIEQHAGFAQRIACPTLVIGGTADPFFDRDVCEETARLIPGGKLRLFEGETHMLPVEKSRAVAGVISGCS